MVKIFVIIILCVKAKKTKPQEEDQLFFVYFMIV